MLTLVNIRSSDSSSREAASLTADYLAFEHRRTERRQYVKAFGGMAIVVAVGAAFGRVPADEAWIVVGLLLLPPIVLGALEAWQWHRLIRRLDSVRGAVKTIKKS